MVRTSPRSRPVVFCAVIASLLIPGVTWAAPARKKDAAVPVDVRVPTLAFDESSLLLVWNKPDVYADIVDYNVYRDGKKLGGARANADQFSPAKKHIDAFYAADKDNFHVKVTFHSFTVTDLQPDTRYTFTVRSVNKDGKESPDSKKLVQRTAPSPKVFNIVDFGAKPGTDKSNTKEIQAAIDACTKGGKVLVPAGVFTSGALFLKSDMTLQIAHGATLLGSQDPAEYPLARGYRLYPYSKHDRPPSLINALSSEAHGAGAFKNIRIVGPGVIDGNGWKRATKASLIDEAGEELPQFVASNNKNVQSDGILAKAQFEQGLKDGLDAKTSYGQRRSSLILIRGGRNLFLGGFTVLNPANHGIMVLDSENVVLAQTRHTTYDANNADGVEFGNSNGVLVFDNFFDTGDDCVNFAAGTGREAAKQKPMQAVWIFGNYFREGHGAVVAGSHTGAWIQKILAEDNVIYHTDAGLRCKSTVWNGGGARDIVFRDSAMKDILKQGFIFTLDYTDANASRDYEDATTPASFRDITVKNVTMQGSRGKEASIKVQGAVEKRVWHQKLTFEDVALGDVNPAAIDGLKDSVFRRVIFTKIKRDDQPWTVTHSEGLSFDGSTENKSK